MSSAAIKHCFTTALQCLTIALMILVMLQPSIATALDKPTQGLLFPMYGENEAACSPDTTGDVGELKGSNPKIAFEFFVAQGYTPFQAAGIVGNLMQESGVNPRSHQNDGGPGRGIAQWSVDGRWADLLDWAARQKPTKDPLVLMTQLEYIMYESKHVAPWDKTWPAVRATATIERATEEFEDKFEKAGQPNMPRRITFARQILLRYGGNTPAASTPAPDTPEPCTAPEADGPVPTGGWFAPSDKFPCKIGKDGGVQDGYHQGKKIPIRICVVGGIEVNVRIEQNLANLLKARSMSGGGFRTMQEQIQTRIRNGCPDIYNSPSSACRVPTARPGYSNHQMGLAIDFELHSGDFKWLQNNAAKYGLKNFPVENWHWSVDGK